MNEIIEILEILKSKFDSANKSKKFESTRELAFSMFEEIEKSVNDVEKNWDLYEKTKDYHKKCDGLQEDASIYFYRSLSSLAAAINCREKWNNTDDIQKENLEYARKYANKI